MDDNEHQASPTRRFQYTFQCHLCQEDHPVMFLIQHTCKCLFSVLKHNDLPIPCFCNTCKGAQPHPSGPVPATVAPPPPSPKPTLPATSILPQPVTIERNADQLRCHTCFYCDERKEKKVPQGQDEMLIGKHRQIKLCMKSELREGFKRLAIEKAIDAEKEIVEKSDDPPPTSEGVLTDSQPDEFASDAAEEWVGCSGYTDEACEKKCKVGNTAELYNTENDDRFKPILTYKQYTPQGVVLSYFCKASHYMRFVNMLHKPNKGKGKSKRQKNTTTITTTTTTTPPTTIDTPQTSTSPTSSRGRGTRGRGSRGGRGRGGRGGGSGESEESNQAAVSN
jgi:hypothetical protein